MKGRCLGAGDSLRGRPARKKPRPLGGEPSHFCEVEDWEGAKRIFLFHVEPAVGKELHDQLGIWGHAKEALELRKKLLGKSTLYIDAVCWKGIGISHQMFHNDYLQAIECFQKSLDIARKISSSELETMVLCSLGAVYRIQGNYSQAMEYGPGRINVYIFGKPYLLIFQV